MPIAVGHSGRSLELAQSSLAHGRGSRPVQAGAPTARAARRAAVRKGPGQESPRRGRSDPGRRAIGSARPVARKAVAAGRSGGSRRGHGRRAAAPQPKPTPPVPAPRDEPSLDAILASETRTAAWRPRSRSWPASRALRNSKTVPNDTLQPHIPAPPPPNGRRPRRGRALTKRRQAPSHRSTYVVFSNDRREPVPFCYGP